MKLSKIKNLLCITLTFILMFIGMKGVLAEEITFYGGPALSSRTNGYDGACPYKGCPKDSYGYAHFLYKQAGGVPYSCVEHSKTSPADLTLQCSEISLSNAQLRAFEYLMKQYTSFRPTSSPNESNYDAYFWVEIIGQKYYNGQTFPSMNSNETAVNTVNAMKQHESDPAPSSGSTSFSFNTYDSETGEWLSTSISGVNGNPSSSPTATVRKQVNQVRIKASSMTPGVKYTVSIPVGGSNYWSVKMYNCGDNYQKLIKPVEKSSSGTAKGAITLTNSLKANKKDSKGNYIAGAEFTITGPNGYSKKITTTTTDVLVEENLPFGEYCITAEKAPTGYTPYDFTKDPNKNTRCYKFTGASLTQNGVMSITDDKTEVKISKQDIANSKEIKGATLEILDKDKKPIDRTKEEYKCVVISPEKFINSKEISWISGDKAVTINCLPDGEYYLHEILPANGYTATEKQGTYLKFTMEDGKPKNGNVVMKNELTTVLISKLDASSKKEIKGATLSILDESKKQIDLTEEKYANVQIVDGEFIKDKGVSWVSTGETMEIQGLPIGTYYLVEDMAPAGYVKEKEMVEIEITMDGVISKASITNTLKVNVPNTGMNAWGYVIIGGLLLIVGMVVVYFVTRKKA